MMENGCKGEAMMMIMMTVYDAILSWVAIYTYMKYHIF